MSIQLPLGDDTNSMTTLVITKIGHFFKNEEEIITGTDGNLLFFVTKSKSNRRILRDPNGYPLLTIYEHQKWFSMDEYKIFKGDSIDQSNLLWTANASSMFEFSSIMDVFAVTNMARKPCDFKIKKKSFSESYYFHSGYSDVVVAKIKTINKLENFLKGKQTRRLEIFQKVDLSFIVSLYVVLDMFEETKGQSSAGGD
ncbi:hypothetical protein ZOSMA_9G01770 [Zostera marina]|uniref:Protein LURP-one-related 15 n=1 Tax=Zostera marina TaxID=29655 RepID=A0A0K9NJB6_ZOSMR|nr:hypothetical protein ZOSMA_9G01770 [Zostera marina]